MIRDRMIEFRINEVGRSGRFPGEMCYLRVNMIMCLFPENRQIKTINGWTLDVYEEDWDKVEEAFRYDFLGEKAHPI